MEAPESKTRGIFYQKGGFKPKHCDQPRLVPQVEGLPGNGGYSWVPCGRCPSCLRRKRSEWYSRLKIEHRNSDTCYFLTLTYKDEYLVYPSVDPATGEFQYVRGLHSSSSEAVPLSPQPCVYKPDLQGFFKRLRNFTARSYLLLYERVRAHDRWLKSLNDYYSGHRKTPPRGTCPPRPDNFVKGNYPKLRYYAISEYGPRTNRPHYHVVLFGFPPDGDIYKAIEESWLFGDINTATPASDAALMYVANYHLDRFVAPPGAPPNFNLISSRPGIGHLFSHPFSKSHDYEDESKYFAIKIDRNLRLPLGRYLRNRMYEKEEIPIPNFHDNGLTPSESLESSMRKEHIRRRKSKKYI